MLTILQFVKNFLCSKLEILHYAKDHVRRNFRTTSYRFVPKHFHFKHFKHSNIFISFQTFSSSIGTHAYTKRERVPDLSYGWVRRGRGVAKYTVSQKKLCK